MSNVTTYTVTGMTCTHCVVSVTEEVQEIPQVERVEADLATGALRVTSERPLDEAAVRAAVEDAGYGLDMNTPVRIAGFVGGLAVVFGVAVAAGASVGPVSETAAPHDADTHTEGAHDESSTGVSSPDQTEIPGGLMINQSGYGLALADPVAEAGDDVPVSFVIRDPQGTVLTTYDTSHEKDLHLIAVRRDLSGFQHVHPRLAADGSWSASLDLTPGEWRLYGDFKPADEEALTLGADLSVPGEYQPSEPAAPTRVAKVGDYTVTLAGDLIPGSDARLTVSVTRNGQPLDDLQPYLGSFGHLVALRDGDLAYLHVHPDGSPDDGVTEPGPEVVFYAAVPSEGGYGLFFDFRHRGIVRTAEFMASTTWQPAAPPESDHDDGAGHSDR